MTTPPLEYSALLQMHDSVISAFQEKWEKASKNERRMLGENWTEEEKEQIKAQDRKPYSFPIAASYVQRIIATQRQTRQGWKAEPKLDPKDEVKAELAGLLLRQYETQNDMPEIETSVFEDGLAISYGADKFEIDTDTGTITNRQIDYRNLVWDINSMSPDLSDALFVSEIEKVYRKDLPEELRTAPAGGDAYGRGLQGYYVSSSTNGSDYDIVSIFHHYQRTKKKFWVVYVKDSRNLLDLPDVKVKFKTKKQAEKFVETINRAYEMLYFLDADGETEIRQEMYYVWDYYKLTYSGLIEYKELNWDYHPYNVYRSMKVKNDWVSLLDFMDSPQSMLDRIVSQIDYSLKKELKQVYELDITRLAKGESPESAARKMSITGGIIYKQGNGKVISETATSGINPQYMQIVGLTTDFLSELIGGKNMLGNQESASESGRAVALRQQQGKLVAFLFLSRLENYKLKKGEKLLYYIQKYDTVERVVKVAGDSLSPELKQELEQNGVLMKGKINPNLSFVKVNFNEITMLENAKLEIKVETAPMTETERAYKLQQMQEAEATTPILTQLPSWTMQKLTYMDLDSPTKQKILEELAQMQQQQRQQQEENQRIERAQAVLKALPQTKGAQ